MGEPYRPSLLVGFYIKGNLQIYATFFGRFQIYASYCRSMLIISELCSHSKNFWPKSKLNLQIYVIHVIQHEFCRVMSEITKNYTSMHDLCRTLLTFVIQNVSRNFYIRYVLKYGQNQHDKITANETGKNKAWKR